MPELKCYQRDALQTLSEYLRECARTGDPDTAFYGLTRERFGRGIPYRPVAGMEGMPYVCVRVPTGGGKTVMACEAIGIATRELLRAARSLALWLVPSKAICDQTLAALRDPRHFHRQTLDAALGSVTALDVNEALSLPRHALDGGSVVVVATLQAFRVEDTEGRRVYEPNGALMEHFTGWPAEATRHLERMADGAFVCSLANVMRLRAPVVIVDEAHNARTGLSFETLARLRPACILEFTATPDVARHPSNVIHTVSAAELKAEEMVKLPVQFQRRDNWQELLAEAVAMREQLEQIARLERQETGEYIRPIMLIQAQPRRGVGAVTVETVRQALLDDHRIPPEHVREATGENNELYDIPDISAPDCPARYVITVQALREGWDCPFAYVLCSLAELRASTAVEQILGRVLRMPGARRKRRAELNRAYAFAISPGFEETARALRDALVDNGFNRQEVDDLVAPIGAQFPLSGDESPMIGLWQGLTAAPAERAAAPAERGEPFRVPGLAIEQRSGQSMSEGMLRELFEETHLREEMWSLRGADAALSEAEFPSARPAGQSGLVDVDAQGAVTVRYLEDVRARQMALMTERWNVGQLIWWLARNIRHDDLETVELELFLQRMVRDLTDRRGFAIEELARDKIRLRAAAEAKIDQHRRAARRATFARLLLPDAERRLVVHPDICFSFDPQEYPCNSVYSGAYQFRRHYYPRVGDLRSEGEEFRCAQFLDQLPEVEFWVRNIERRPQHSFWLQTSSDRFYPDFVCRLTDGRILVVEYKGADRWSNDDSREKRDLGELWEARSSGACLFIMPKGPDFESIRAKVSRT